MFFSDARIYQILFLSLFLVLGIGTRDWTLQPGIVCVAIATCLLTQWTLLSMSHPETGSQHESNSESEEQEDSRNLIFQPVSFSAYRKNLPSALITALGLSLLLRTDHYSTMILAGICAISSKFFLKIRGKHIFNPANFGIVAVLLLTQDAWVSPGQWGEESWYALVFLSTGGLVLNRVGRWDTTLAFLGSYAFLEAIRNYWLGWTWDVWGHRLMSGSLLLFALFMVTDPRTIPNARIARLIWAGAIAVITFILRNYFFLSTAVFWALFVMAPFTILLDWMWQAPRFFWVKDEPNHSAASVNS